MIIVINTHIFVMKAFICPESLLDFTGYFSVELYSTNSQEKKLKCLGRQSAILNF